MKQQRKYTNRLIQHDLERLCTLHTAEEVRRLRRIMLRLTKHHRTIPMELLIKTADVSESFIKYCYESKLLKGYHYDFGVGGGFYRTLQLAVDNT